MRITARTDYAIRALVELAHLVSSNDAGLAASVETLAIRQQIGAPFLASIFAQMRVAGLVRRAGGGIAGFSLARPAEEITLAQVVDATDALFGTIAGRSPEELLYPGAAASLRDVWISVRITSRLALESTTIADIAAGKVSAFHEHGSEAPDDEVLGAQSSGSRRPNQTVRIEKDR